MGLVPQLGRRGYGYAVWLTTEDPVLRPVGQITPSGEFTVTIDQQSVACASR